MCVRDRARLLADQHLDPADDGAGRQVAADPARSVWCGPDEGGPTGFPWPPPGVGRSRVDRTRGHGHRGSVPAAANAARSAGLQGDGGVRRDRSSELARRAPLHRWRPPHRPLSGRCLQLRLWSCDRREDLRVRGHAGPNPCGRLPRRLGKRGAVSRPTGSAHLEVAAQSLSDDIGCRRVIIGSPLVERSTKFRVEAHRERTSRVRTHRRTSRPASAKGFRSGRGGLRTPDSLLVRQVL